MKSFMGREDFYDDAWSFVRFFISFLTLVSRLFYNYSLGLILFDYVPSSS